MSTTTTDASSSSEKTEVCLTGQELVVHQWKAGEGSFVNKGDVIALARNKNATVEAGAAAAVAKSHRRPRMRGRNKPVAATSEEETASVSSSEATTPLVSIIAPATGLLHRVKDADSSSTPLVIASIAPCTHPAVIDTMCAVCGNSMIPDEAPATTAYVPSGEKKRTMESVTVAGFTMKVSQTEAKSISQSQTERLYEQKKLSLVLDLDHTLVHATADPRASQYEDRDDVRALLLPAENGQMMHHRVKLRPHLQFFLSQPNYEVTVYTAGTRAYAEQITVILGRHMVGAQLDHYDLLQLQNRVKHAEARFETQAGSESKPAAADPKPAADDSKPAAESTPVAESEPGEDPKPVATADEQEDTNKRAAPDSDEASSPPRKRVRFGEPASNVKTDEKRISLEELEELRAELKEAEAKEKEALEMRQKIFGSRIVSRTDVGDLGRDVKSLKRIFPCGGTMSVIADDREDVWANAKEMSKEPPHNLLLVQPYHWKPFSGFADINNAAGADLSMASSGKDDVPANLDTETDKQLLWTQYILERVHSRYYARNGKMTVPEILKEMRHETLRGCNIILSGLVPLHKQQDDYKGPRHPLLRYTESMGAKLLNSIDPTLTHVVAAADGTEKIVRARKIPGCYIVKASWLMESYWSLKKSRELDHLLGSPPKPRIEIAASEPASAASNGSAAPASNSTDDDDDDEDDGFADELWEA